MAAVKAWYFENLVEMTFPFPRSRHYISVGYISYLGMQQPIIWTYVKNKNIEKNGIFASTGADEKCPASMYRHYICWFESYHICEM